MLQLYFNGLKLFLRGKLFRDYRDFARRWCIGVVATATGLLALAKLGLPIWLAVTATAVLGGTLQPYLFKDLKFN